MLMPSLCGREHPSSYPYLAPFIPFIGHAAVARLKKKDTEAMKFKTMTAVSAAEALFF